MSELARIDRQKAKQNPRSAFVAPSEIVEQPLLTRGEKIAALDAWRQDVLIEMTATDDGMRSYGVSEQLAAQLRQIERAYGRLTKSG